MADRGDIKTVVNKTVRIYPTLRFVYVLHSLGTQQSRYPWPGPTGIPVTTNAREILGACINKSCRVGKGWFRPFSFDGTALNNHGVSI